MNSTHFECTIWSLLTPVYALVAVATVKMRNISSPLSLLWPSHLSSPFPYHRPSVWVTTGLFLFFKIASKNFRVNWKQCPDKTVLSSQKRWGWSRWAQRPWGPAVNS